LCAESINVEDLMQILVASGMCNEDAQALVVQTPGGTEQPRVIVEATAARLAAAASADRAFANWARTNHVKQCPGCSSPIQKHGGCDHMHCFSCNRRFGWKDAEFFTHCKGFHPVFCFPFVAKCPHVACIPQQHRLEYRVRKSAVLLPAGMIFAPFLIGFAAYELTIWCHKNGPIDLYRKRMRARALEKRNRDLRANAALELERLREVHVACRQTNAGHHFVADWCSNCGRIRVDIGNPDGNWMEMANK